MEDLRMAAAQEGKPQWGDKGPQNAGYYNSLPSGVPFFGEGEEGFLSDYGRFFLVCILFKLASFNISISKFFVVKDLYVAQIMLNKGGSQVC
jgi:hypothetical protein